jgi:hypothetical protein
VSADHPDLFAAQAVAQRLEVLELLRNHQVVHGARKKAVL